MRDFVDCRNRFYDIFLTGHRAARQSQIIKDGLEFRLAAPPILADNWKAAIRHITKVLIYPPDKEYRRWIPAALAPQNLWPLLSKLAPPLAILAICISVFHFLSPKRNFAILIFQSSSKTQT
jgi:hypothetical protein